MQVLQHNGHTNQISLAGNFEAPNSAPQLCHKPNGSQLSAFALQAGKMSKQGSCFEQNITLFHALL